MQTDHVVFTSPHFIVEPGEDEDINPGIYGKALAAWIAERLRGRGYSVELIEEDFGRLVMVQRKPFWLWVGCANVDGSTTQWQLFLAAEFTWVARLFRRVNPEPQIAELRKHLRAIAQEIPAVSNVQWQEKHGT